MKCVWILLAAVTAALGQTATSSIRGTVVDAQSLKPVPAALVTAVRSGVPPFAKRSKSGGDGAFDIQGLSAGSYSVCVQAAGDQYLDPCQWNGSPTTVTLGSGPTATGISVKLAQASVVYVQVTDSQKVLSQLTKDGRQPDLTVGVWGPSGLYYPARRYASESVGSGQAATGYSFRLAVPRGPALKLNVTSRDVKLGDAAGLALPSNAAQQTIQSAAGDASPQAFSFSVLGLLP